MTADICICLEVTETLKKHVIEGLTYNFCMLIEVWAILVSDAVLTITCKISGVSIAYIMQIVEK